MAAVRRRAVGLVFVSLASAARAGAGACPAEGSDWLTDDTHPPARVWLEDGRVILANGLVRREFVVEPNWATVELLHEGTGHGFLRALAPEAQLELGLAVGSTTLCTQRADVGGALSPSRGAILELGALGALRADGSAFRYVRHEVGAVHTRFEWRPPAWRRAPNASWPPRGVHLAVHFAPPAPPAGGTCAQRAAVVVHYELYDGLPLLAKWVEVAHARDDGAQRGLELVVISLSSELLRVTEGAEPLVGVETDFMPRKTFWRRAHGLAPLATGPYASRRLDYPHWRSDVTYSDNSAFHALQADAAWPLLVVNVSYPLGPDQPIGAGVSFAFMRVHVLLHDSAAAERQSLGRRRVLRLLAPQLLEAPLYFATNDASAANVRAAAEQLARLRIDALLLSFGSGVEPASEDDGYIERVRADVQYAMSLGVRVGSYTLMQNPPNQSADVECVDPDSRLPAGIADLTTVSHDAYRARVLAFARRVGLSMLECDGPFEGAACLPGAHSRFRSLANSQLAQYGATVRFLAEAARRGIYLTVPDPYFLSAGSNREPMGYTDEWTRAVADNWEHLTIGRMYLHDGTTHKPPTAGWMVFDLERLPPARADGSATPERLELLEWALASYVGQGNRPAFRGRTPYPPGADAGAEAELWRAWLAHWHEHRQVLAADVLHVRRPNGRSLELSVHALAGRAAGAERALGFVFNPTNASLRSHALTAPLHYAGLCARGRVRWGGSRRRDAAWPVPAPTVEQLDERARLPLGWLRLRGRSFVWFVVEAADDAPEAGDAPVGGDAGGRRGEPTPPVQPRHADSTYARVQPRPDQKASLE